MMERSDAASSADSVCVSFGGTRAVDDVSLEVRSGESVAIVGSSGSGKSTLLHCLAGLRVPDSGSVHFSGQSLSTLSDSRRSELRLASMGIVFQFGELIPELTIVENVALPAWMSGCSRPKATQAATALLEQFSIADLADRYPGRVSGGERQRAAVARALVHDPSIVFADEPTGSLDSENANTVMNSLIGCARDRGTSLVLITHERRFDGWLDRTVTMSDGRIVGEARH